jgi:hypothetical protein
VGHDRRPGADTGPRRRAVDLLDVLGDSRLVGGALDERGLDLGALDAALDVGDEEIGNRVGVAGLEEDRQVVVGVDARAGDDLEARPLGDLAHEPDVAAEEHRRRVGDRPHPELESGARGLERGIELATGLDRALWDAAERARLGPLRMHALVTRDQVLVDQRCAQLARVDRAGDGLDCRQLRSPPTRVRSESIFRARLAWRSCRASGPSRWRSSSPASSHRW